MAVAINRLVTPFGLGLVIVRPFSLLNATYLLQSQGSVAVGAAAEHADVVDHASKHPVAFADTRGRIESADGQGTGVRSQLALSVCHGAIRLGWVPDIA